MCARVLLRRRVDERDGSGMCARPVQHGWRGGVHGVCSGAVRCDVCVDQQQLQRAVRGGVLLLDWVGERDGCDLSRGAVQRGRVVGVHAVRSGAVRPRRWADERVMQWHVCCGNVRCRSWSDDWNVHRQLHGRVLLSGRVDVSHAEHMSTGAVQHGGIVQLHDVFGGSIRQLVGVGYGVMQWTV